MTTPLQFDDIATAQFVKTCTVADLLMENGRVYRCSWSQRGRVTAWWPLVGQRRKSIGLYNPVGWRIVEGVTAIGIER
jgi:hypothetical protein